MASGWSADPREAQQVYYKLLADVCAYHPKTSKGLLILRKKVGYATYGKPDQESTCGNAHTGYSEKKYNTIKNVVDFVIDINNKKTRQRDELHMAIVFVFVDYDGQLLQFPVFRILLTERTWKFVDTNCRVYSSWEQFLALNEFPPGKYCCPLNGIYSGDSEDNVRLQWGITPAERPGRKVLDAMDKASSVAALGAAAVGLAGLLTPLGPALLVASVCGGVAGAYTTARGGAALIDRGVHGQTVNPLKDRQAALSWLSVAGSAVGVAAGAATSRAAALARSGEVMGRAGRVACNALNATSLAINATELGIGAFTLRERVQEGEASALEVLQFTASVLFFTHATVSFRTASRIIKETQRGVIQDFEQSLRSNRHRKQFDKLAKDTAATGKNSMDGNAKVIRGIRSIHNKDDFFAGMVRSRKEFRGHKAVFSENGNIIVNGGAEIHPMKLYELGKKQRTEFLSLAKQVSQGTITDAAFRTRFETVLNTNAAGSPRSNTSLSSDATEAVNSLTSQLQQGSPGITVGRREVLLMLTVVDELTNLVCSETDNQYAVWWKRIWNQTSKLVREMYETYDEALNAAKQLNTFVNEVKFNLEYGIGTASVFIHFVTKVYERYKNHIDELKNDIEEMMTNENVETKDEICPRCKKAM